MADHYHQFYHKFFSKVGNWKTWKKYLFKKHFQISKNMSLSTPELSFVSFEETQSLFDGRKSSVEWSKVMHKHTVRMIKYKHFWEGCWPYTVVANMTFSSVKPSISPSNVALNANPKTVLKSACPEDSKTPPTC